MTEKDQDRRIERIAAELRRPVPADPGARARILGETTGSIGGGYRDAGRRTGRRRAPWRLAAVGVAAAAVIALAVYALESRPGAADRGAPPRADMSNGGTGATGIAEGARREAAEPGAESRPVRFVFAARNASRIALVGDFNDWDPDATPLSASGDGGSWSAVLRLTPGAYRYAFLVDDRRWAPDPSAPRAPGNDFGIPSSLVLVTESGT